ncbi:MAG: hypothetical protein IKN64_10085 [Desulfovibrio sp.]|nr:hypothetical protein [Desulfovibrio sp.]
MSEISAQNMLTETSYKTEAWHYRHAVVTGIIFFFSIFFIAARGLWGAISGGYHGVVDSWNEQVKPFMSSLNNPTQPSTATVNESGTDQQQ